ncbi:MAG: helicase C-terminal domain-containing protein [Cyanobacteria bacterium P01_F01_bin.53]
MCHNESRLLGINDSQRQPFLPVFGLASILAPTPSQHSALPVIETEVHQRLRAYLREQGHTQWPHHLTMARLVARALRVGRNALMQTDSLAAYQGNHRLSYLMPALLWPEPAILALPEDLTETVLQQDIPNLQQALPVVKPVLTGDRWPNESFRGLLVTSTQTWLRDRLTGAIQTPPSPPSNHKKTSGQRSYQPQRRFPAGIPTLIDGASELERWAREQLSISISGQDWEALMLAYPGQREFIRDMRVRITHTIFQHPANPYGCHLIDAPEYELLSELCKTLEDYGDNDLFPKHWSQFWHQLTTTERLAWSHLDRQFGSLSLYCGPTDIQEYLAPVWAQQPIVLIGAALDADRKAKPYRDRLGLGKMTCLHFGPDRHNDLIQLYLPDRLPMPNTSQFKAAVLEEIRTLLSAKNAARHPATHLTKHPPDHPNGKKGAKQSNHRPLGPTVILIGDVPLKAQLAAILAAEFGSRVQVEESLSQPDTTTKTHAGILVTGWEYWRKHQSKFETPSLLIITTLPIPSLENPLVAGRVATYKSRRQDWFKAYLLPEALSELQHAVAPVRSQQGIVVLLDNRVNHRSYGSDILEALSPAARSSYFDKDWFSDTNTPKSR